MLLSHHLSLSHSPPSFPGLPALLSPITPHTKARGAAQDTDLMALPPRVCLSRAPLTYREESKPLGIAARSSMSAQGISPTCLPPPCLPTLSLYCLNYKLVIKTSTLQSYREGLRERIKHQTQCLEVPVMCLLHYVPTSCTSREFLFIYQNRTQVSAHP